MRRHRSPSSSSTRRSCGNVDTHAQIPFRALIIVSTAHIIQQYFGSAEVGGVKAFGECTVDHRQELASVLALVLALPQPTQPHRSAEFERLCPLTSGEGEGLLETGFCLFCMRHAECGMRGEDGGRLTLDPGL